MKNLGPTISSYMTPTPHTIGPKQSIALAKKMMRDLNVRHLPVQSGGALVGILSQSDIELLHSFKDIDTKRALVCDAMADDPYSVRPDAALKDVCIKMAEDKISSALVVNADDKVIGIFTYIDALGALVQQLHAP